MSVSGFRASMSAGVAFVAFLVIGVFVGFGNGPNINSHDSDAVAAAKYVDTLSKSSHRTGILVGAYLIILAGIAFVWFTQGLRAQLESILAGRLVAALGVLGAAALVSGAMALSAVAGAVSFGHEPLPQDGDISRIVMDLAFPFVLVVFALTSAVLIATVAIAGRRSGIPLWLVYGAWLAVLGAIFSVIFLPMIVTMLWYLIVAVTGIARPRVPVAQMSPSLQMDPSI